MHSTLGCPTRVSSHCVTGRPRCLVHAPVLIPTRHAGAAVHGARRSSPGPCYASIFGSGDAKATTTVSESSRKWWHKDEDLWIQVHNDSDFDREVVNEKNKPVVVDWFAPWCGGCERSYPEVCKAIRQSEELRKGFKFVKICVDDFPKSFSRDQGVSALPRMSVYRPGQGKLITFDIPHSRVKFLKQNLHTILANPNSSFTLDPNSFVVPSGAAPTAVDAAKVAAARAAEVAALEASTGGLFERLKSVAGINKDASGSAASAGSVSSVDNGRTTSSNSPAPRPSVPSASAAAASTAEDYVASFVLQYGQSYALTREMFLNKYRGEYGYGGRIDSLYPKEVGVRMKPLGDGHLQQHYLDYTGSSVYCQSQLEAAFEELRSTMFGNPHSQNPSSSLSSDRIDEVRALILKFFNADPSDWQIVFTRSATGALKMVGETFPWSQGSMFRYLRENHNSVLGIREYALQHGGAFQAVDEELVEKWVRGDTALDHSPEHNNSNGHSNGNEETTYSLFAFAAEENYAGVKYPLSWASDIKRRSTDKHKWMVLVDAAAYVPTQPLDLSTVDADFVDVAFYKMFGYPTGLGALLVRTEAVPLLRKVFWGGGSVALATSKDNFHVLKCKPTDKLEDGTVSFLDIISLKHGFNRIADLGGVAKIQVHVAALTEWTFNAMSQLKHSNGAPMMKIFGKHHQFNHRQVQGGIINFELLDPAGQPLSYRTFEREAAEAGFHVRTGAECNPGACYKYLGVTEAEVESLAGKKEGCDDDVEFITVQRPDTAAQAVSSKETLSTLATSQVVLGHPGEVALKWAKVPLGSVRASLGWMSTFEDCYALVDFVQKRYKDRAVAVGDTV